MSLRNRLLDLGQQLADVYVASRPERRPTAAAASKTRIIAHRGNTGSDYQENTLPAFLRCLELGVGGIELDIQWTRDDVPVVIHDADTLRVFGTPGIIIAETSFETLTRVQPLVCSLEEVIHRFAGRCHLMIEIKAETIKSRHFSILQKLLSNLVPRQDYHLLALGFELVDGLPLPLKSAVMMVAETNTREIIDGVMARGLPGCSGHYLLFTRNHRKRLIEQGCQFGVGFVRSRYGLYREIHGGSRWIFTNHAGPVQGWLDDLQ